MSTQILALGDGTFGLLEPASAPHAETVCFVLLNPGFVDRRGPFRLHVRLARALAAQGFHCFRHDAPGIGDSLSRSSVPLLESSLAVLDALEARTGCRRFVVGGICSAADLGWQMALADPRVVGVLQVDGLLRKGFWHRFARVLRALRKPPREWRDGIAARWHRRVADRRAGAPVDDDRLRDWPDPGSERAQMRALVARRVEMFFVFTGGASYVLHPRQFAATYGVPPNRGPIEVAFWPQCDHTFFAEPHRRLLIASIVAWAGVRFAAGGGRPAASGGMLRAD